MDVALKRQEPAAWHYHLMHEPTGTTYSVMILGPVVGKGYLVYVDGALVSAGVGAQSVEAALELANDYVMAEWGY